MKAFLRSLPHLCLLVVLGGFLAGAAPSSAQSSSRRHHRKETPTKDDADPDDQPSPSRRTRGQKSDPDEKTTAAASSASSAAPATKKGDSEDVSPPKSPDVKPTSADEAAPSKAPASAAGNPAKNAASAAAVSTIDPAELEGFDANPEPIRKLLTAALDLTRRNLTYAYGSTDPANGGMDCSGTIYYLLNQSGFSDVPRQANEQYDWVRRKSRFYAVLSKKQDNFELREMRPGDLLFWTGTYRVDRDPPVTHVMVYLGKRRSDGHRLMFGASDGRPYDGQRRNGVSVFDFKMPAARSGDAADVATTAAPDHAPDFSGYGPVPGMTDLADAASRQTAAAKGVVPEGSAARSTPSDGQDPAATSKPQKPRASNHPRGQ